MEEKLPHFSDFYPRVAKVARAVMRWAMGPNEPFASHGNHFVHTENEWGQLVLPLGDPYAPNGWGCDNRWDDMGTYYEGDLSSLPRARE